MGMRHALRLRHTKLLPVQIERNPHAPMLPDNKIEGPLDDMVVAIRRRWFPLRYSLTSTSIRQCLGGDVQDEL